MSEQVEGTVGDVRVYVKTLDMTFAVDVDVGLTVKDLKVKLVGSELKRLAENKKVRLIHLGKLLKDDDVIGAVLTNESVIHCVLSAMTENKGDENSPEGVTTPIDLEGLLEEDRRIAQWLQAQSIQQGNEETDGLGFRSTRASRQQPRAAAPEMSPVTSFFISFAIGFSFGFLTIFFAQRLSRKQLAGLVLGILCNLMLDHMRQVTAIQANAVSGQVQSEHLDRFGNVVSQSQHLRGS
mmetsp:Transcript_20749/g.34275  ORF Transcript_20749/g.34275 Transcript_20749/m.34275 type:complete len:238 (-) Transcript_20749:259-972(-)